jgi:hypothetical protein
MLPFLKGAEPLLWGKLAAPYLPLAEVMFNRSKHRARPAPSYSMERS